MKTLFEISAAFADIVPTTKSCRWFGELFGHPRNPNERLWLLQRVVEPYEDLQNTSYDQVKIVLLPRHRTVSQVDGNESETGRGSNYPGHFADLTIGFGSRLGSNEELIDFDSN